MTRDDLARAAVIILGDRLSTRLTALAAELASVNQTEYARMLRCLAEDAERLEEIEKSCRRET